MAKFKNVKFTREVVVVDGHEYDDCDFTECVVIGDDEDADTLIEKSRFKSCLFVGAPMIRAVREAGLVGEGAVQ